MLALKEKMSDKLSRLLGDSPSLVASQSPEHPQGSTLRHGISLRTLLRKSADLPGPGILGTHQTFVFTTISGEPRLFRTTGGFTISSITNPSCFSSYYQFTGVNRYFYLCLTDLLAFGGGGNFALSLGEDLLNGTNGPRATFGNACLAFDPEFELKNVELWGFPHSSRYLL